MPLRSRRWPPPAGGGTPAARPQSSGRAYAEADFVKVGPTLAGLLTAVFVERGVKVDRGVQLFDQDDISDRAALDQTARQLRQAEAQVVNLQSSGKPTEIQLAEANLADAHAARDKLWADLQRTERLLASGTASVQLAEQQRADLRSATAKIQGFEAALAQLRNPLGRESEIKAQQEAVEAARAAVADDATLSVRLRDQHQPQKPPGGTPFCGAFEI